MHPTVLSEDDRWCWLAKPPGLPVFPPHHNPEGPSLYRWLVNTRPEQDQPFPLGFAGGLAHRLDTATSGVVLAARSPASLAEVRQAFASGQLKKTYRFLTHKEVPWQQHQVNTELAHHPRRKDRMVPRRGRSTAHRGRWYEAETHLQHLGGPLWEATITTGVMHQIRAHAASVGLALTGDRIYGGGTSPPHGAPEDVSFGLHHLGLEGAGLRSPTLAPPDWWRAREPGSPTGDSPRTEPGIAPRPWQPPGASPENEPED